MILCVFKIRCETVLTVLYKKADSSNQVSLLQGFSGDQECAFEVHLQFASQSHTLVHSAEQFELVKLGTKVHPAYACTTNGHSVLRPTSFQVNAPKCVWRPQHQLLHPRELLFVDCDTC